ncbi:MAG: TetR/AcrR family transcriptional regulator [Halioglobus sp.]
MNPPTKAVFTPRKMPSQARARATVERILNGTRLVLKEKGAEAATTRNIADASGVTTGSIYQYFPHKESILYELYRQRMAATVEAFRALLASDALEQGVDFFLDRFGHMLWDELEWGRPEDIALDKAIGENPELRLAVADVLDELYHCIVSMLKYYGCNWTDRRMMELAEYLYSLNHFGFALRVRQEGDQSDFTRMLTTELQTHLIKKAINEEEPAA